MSSQSLMNVAPSVKTEVGIALGVALCIVVMPIAAVFAMARGSLDAQSVLYSGPVVSDDTYAWGNCTYWAALRRIQIGKPLPASWGNAATWDNGALASGYLVDHIPRVGAIMQTDVGEFGHVAFVERVSPDASWTISEMNVRGLDVVDTQTLPALAATHYNFIHEIR